MPQDLPSAEGHCRAQPILQVIGFGMPVLKGQIGLHGNFAARVIQRRH